MEVMRKEGFSCRREGGETPAVATFFLITRLPSLRQACARRFEPFPFGEDMRHGRRSVAALPPVARNDI
jgi:hypothetical protein